MLGNPAGLADYLDLVLLRLAKLRRRKLESTEAVEGFYEEFFTDNDERVFTSGQDRRKSHKAEILDAVVRRWRPDGGRLLDVGCGVGDNLRAVARPGLDTVGLEYSGGTIARARRGAGPALTLVRGSATEIPLPSECCDVVLCIEVIEHVADQYEALREIHRVLRRDGALVLSVPYLAWFPSYYTYMGHIRHYTRTDLQDLLSSQGFRVVEWLPNFPTWHRLANYCHIACRVAALGLGVFGVRRSPHEVGVPFSRRKLLEVLNGWIEPVRAREASQDYSTMPTSTFVLCAKSK